MTRLTKELINGVLNSTEMYEWLVQRELSKRVLGYSEALKLGCVFCGGEVPNLDDADLVTTINLALNNKRLGEVTPRHIHRIEGIRSVHKNYLICNGVPELAKAIDAPRTRTEDIELSEIYLLLNRHNLVLKEDRWRLV